MNFVPTKSTLKHDIAAKKREISDLKAQLKEKKSDKEYTYTMRGRLHRLEDDLKDLQKRYERAK